MEEEEEGDGNRGFGVKNALGKHKCIKHVDYRCRF
jgi:hypothetical protein